MYLSIEEFLKRLKVDKPLLLDARSPSEYAQAHIPGAISFPLLNDDERKEVGIAYKVQGREAAVTKGYDLVGGKFGNYLRKAQSHYAKHIQSAGISPIQKTVYLYCWRGGLRSNIMAWVLRTGGFEVVLLKNGYKAYRNHVLEVLNTERKIVVLGGKTGTGKTDMLEELRKTGEQVISLEKLANHRGSAFGALGMPPQPRNEHFENMLAEQWEKADPLKILWLENESQSIGSIVLQKTLFERMRTAAVVEMEMSKEMRIQRILKEYKDFSVEDLIACTKKIEQRLGGQRTTEAVEALQSGDYEKWVDITLSYYDKTYDYGIETRAKGTVMKVTIAKEDSIETRIQKIREAAEHILNSEAFRNATRSEVL